MIPNSGKQAGFATHHGVSSWTLPGVLDLYFWEAAWEEKSSSKRFFLNHRGRLGKNKQITSYHDNGSVVGEKSSAFLRVAGGVRK